MGSHAETENGEYSDIDMIFVARDGVESYFHKNGDPYWRRHDRVSRCYNSTR